MNSLKAILKTLLIALTGLVLGVSVAVFAGENPLTIAGIIIKGAFGNSFDFGLTVYYASILIFSGLAVSLPFKAGVFNIGGEGQIIVASMACTLVGLWLGEQVPAPVAVVLGLAAAFLGGAVWGGIAGWIRSYRGGHEVISSIMLNFIASGVTGWLTINYFRANDSQNPETSGLASNWIWERLSFFEGAPVTMVSVLAPIVTLILWVVLAKTVWGFAINAIRGSSEASQISGINVAKTRFLSLAIGGGLAGLAGALMVFGDAGRFRMDMSSGFGFMGIPVALLGKGHPVGVFFAAILFAVLHQGSSALDLESASVGRDLAQIMQAIVVIVVVSESLFSKSFWSKVRS